MFFHLFIDNRADEGNDPAAHTRRKEQNVVYQT
ncbi:hypothetical protein GGE20_006238, partial [Rhizobium leguminosarum]|nr:hypothetical protein [Rhizobium leguminosarum]